MNTAPQRVVFMIGHDDDVVLDPSVATRRRGCTSRFSGMQSDAAIVRAVEEACPHLTIETTTTVEGLLETEAEVVVIISYRTQPFYAWYTTFFEALETLEARGVTVYPSSAFKQTISSKAAYTRLLQAQGLPMCPTEIVDRAECVGPDGALQPALVDARFGAALTSLGLLTSNDGAEAVSPFHLVTKPSNADGGFGVAFWEDAGHAPPATAPPPAADGENVSVQRHPPLGKRARDDADRDRNENRSACSPSAARTVPRPLTQTMLLRTMLTAGCDLGATSLAAANKGGGGSAVGGGGGGGGGGSLVDYLRDVGFVGERPHLLVQPLVPLLGQHFEIKIFFLRRRPFFAALAYGKEKLMAKVARPSSDPELFAYLKPLLDESRRALDALPADGPHDPKILMRVDWGTGEPLLPVRPTHADAEAATAAAAEASPGFLSKALVKRAPSLAAPQKKLRQAMERHGVAPLAGPSRHFINEVEIHPGYYVDWDETPDETIVPLAEAYGDYLTKLFKEKRGVAESV